MVEKLGFFLDRFSKRCVIFFRLIPSMLYSRGW